jgi:alpha-galactosidase
MMMQWLLLLSLVSTLLLLSAASHVSAAAVVDVRVPLQGAADVVVTTPAELFALPDGPPWPELAATPNMAYNGWLASTEFMGYNNETLYYNLVDQLVKCGLRDAGYRTIGVTCNGWVRDETTHKLTLPTTGPRAWPRGFKALVDYAHKHGVKIAAYTDTGTINCCGEPGAFGERLWI